MLGVDLHKPAVSKIADKTADDHTNGPWHVVDLSENGDVNTGYVTLFIRGGEDGWDDWDAIVSAVESHRRSHG